MALAGFTKACSAHTPGLTRLILFGSSSIELDATTALSADSELTLLAVDTIAKAQEYVVDRYGLKATFEGKSDDSGLKVFTHKLEVHISKITGALRKELNAILDEAVCGITAIITDANGTSWIYGLTHSGAVIAATQIGMGVESANFDSGMKLDEDGMDKVTLTLSGTFSEMPAVVTGTLAADAAAQAIVVAAAAE